jgi:prepilin-type N-terminal cleavage/methylation domain-containing protein
MRFFVPSSPGPAGKSGFTLVEMLIALTLIAVATAISASALRTYYETTTSRRAASVIAGDIAVTRSAAVKLGRNVSLVAREDSLSYVIRSDSGTVLYPRRSFDTESELPLTSLDVQLNGDSMTFNPRGILISGGTRRIDVALSSRGMRVEFNVLGRTRIVKDGS